MRNDTAAFRRLSPDELLPHLPRIGSGTDWPWAAPPRAAEAPPTSVPRISVITPSFNQGPFLEETIRSVLLQGYPQLEYVVVDGGSTDESVSIIERYSPFLDFWVSEPDRGQSHAINKGFEQTSGEIVMWLNSDDRLRPGALHAAAAAFTSHPGVVLVYGDPQIIDQAGAVTQVQRLPDFDAATVLDMSVILPQPAAFIRRTALGDSPLVRDDLHFTMDTELWFRLICVGDGLHLDRIVADSRLWADNKATAQRLRWPDELLRIANEFFERTDIPDHLRDIERRARGGILSTAGAFALEGGDTSAARSLLLRSALTYPPNLWRTHLGGRLVRALFGDRVFVLLRRLRGA